MEREKTTTSNDTPGIREIYKPNDSEKETIDFVYRRKEEMASSKDRKEAELEWTRAIKQWEAARIPQGQDEWQSNHYAPITTSVVESALAEVIDQSPQPLILPRGSEDQPKATAMQHIFEYAWEISNSDIALYNVIKGAFIFGTGIAQEYYFRDPRIITGTGGSQKEEFNYDDVYLENVKLEDFFIDETARDFAGPYAARDCIRRYISNVSDVKQFFKGKVWDPLENAKYIKAGGDTNYYEWYKPPEGIDKEKQVEVLWYWAQKPRDRLVIVINDVLVVDGPNPFRHKELPFAKAIDVKRPHKFYGKGEPALLESIQDETNTIRRMVIDRNHLDIDKMFFVSSRINLSDEDTIARPHGTIPVDDVNSAKAIEYGDIPRSIELSLGHLEDDATIVTGINPRAQALPTTGTATEAAILKESTLKRIRLKVKLFEQEFLVRVGRLRLSNILQYYPLTKIEQIVGEKGENEYQAQLTDLKTHGFLLGDNATDTSAKNYAKIPILGKSIDFGVMGNLVETSQTGYSFFEMRPEYYTPISKAGFDIKFVAGATLPVSKTLMQSKATEMYDRLIQPAFAGIGYSPVKLGDMLLRVNDFNPSDFHLEEETNTMVDQRAMVLINLAMTENKLIMEGKPVTPLAYSTPAHTQVHVAFSASPTFQDLSKNDPRIKVMTDVIVGELAAQESRTGIGQGMSAPSLPNAETAGQIPPRPQTAVSAAGPTAALGGNPGMTSVLPGLIQGGGQAQG